MTFQPKSIIAKTLFGVFFTHPQTPLVLHSADDIGVIGNMFQIQQQISDFFGTSDINLSTSLNIYKLEAVIRKLCFCLGYFSQFQCGEAAQQWRENIDSAFPLTNRALETCDKHLGNKANTYIDNHPIFHSTKNISGSCVSFFHLILFNPLIIDRLSVTN